MIFANITKSAMIMIPYDTGAYNRYEMISYAHLT